MLLKAISQNGWLTGSAQIKAQRGDFTLWSYRDSALIQTRLDRHCWHFKRTERQNSFFFRLTSQFSELLSRNNTGLEYCALISAMKYAKSYSARRIAVFGNRDISNDQKNAGKRGIFQSGYPSRIQWKLALYNIVNLQGCRGMLFCNVDILKGHGNVFGSTAVNWWKTEENNQSSLLIPNSSRWDNRERKLAILLGVREYSHISRTICLSPGRTEIINLHCWLIVKNMAIIQHT